MAFERPALAVRWEVPLARGSPRTRKDEKGEDKKIMLSSHFAQIKCLTLKLIKMSEINLPQIVLSISNLRPLSDT